MSNSEEQETSWESTLSPDTIIDSLGEYADLSYDIYENPENDIDENKKINHLMRFSYDEVDQFIERSHHVGLAITKYLARLRRIRATLIRKSKQRASSLYRADTDKCIGEVPGKLKKDGSTTTPKSSPGMQKKDAEYRQDSYLSDQVWQDQQKEIERQTEIIENLEFLKEAHKNKNFLASKIIEERTKDAQR